MFSWGVGGVKAVYMWPALEQGTYPSASMKYIISDAKLRKNTNTTYKIDKKRMHQQALHVPLQM